MFSLYIIQWLKPNFGGNSSLPFRRPFLRKNHKTSGREEEHELVEELHLNQLSKHSGSGVSLTMHSFSLSLSIHDRVWLDTWFLNN